MTTLASPAQISHEIEDALIAGAWTPSEVAAEIHGALGASRSDIVVTLWDLVDSGRAVPVTSGGQIGFRPAV